MNFQEYEVKSLLSSLPDLWSISLTTSLRTRTSSTSTWLSWLPDKSFPWRGPGTRPSWSTWLAMLPDKSWPCRGTKKGLHDYLNNTTFTIITWSILPLTRSWDRAFMINSSTCSTGKVVSLNKRRSVNLARSANNNIYHSIKKNARSKDLLMRPYHSVTDKRTYRSAEWGKTLAKDIQY